MKSYDTIKELSNKLTECIDSDIKLRLEKYMNMIHSQISNDFKTIFGRELKLNGFHIYVADDTYRQSATGIILNETISDHQDLTIRVECLIDHGRIWLSIKEKSKNPDLKEIIDRIETNYNSEGLAEMKLIYKKATTQK